MAIKINLVVRLQHWMDSVPGQTFLNYAYSWGASIVILGALFKLTHLPGGNAMLFIGMGTEVVVFFLSAFDRPFDKNEIGKELPHEYETDEQIAARLGLTDDEEDDETPETDNSGTRPAEVTAAANAPIFIGGGYVGTERTAITPPQEAADPDTTGTAGDAVEMAAAAVAAATPEGEAPFENEAKRLAEIIRLANDELLRRAQAALSPEMETATQEYIEKLRVLAETFKKVDEQSARLALDSEEMSNLSRTLTAINKTYDLHFKSISQQVGTIEAINEQTRRLALQIEELNGVYGRMIQALTVNMRTQQGPQQQYQPAPAPYNYQQQYSAPFGQYSAQSGQPAPQPAAPEAQPLQQPAQTVIPQSGQQQPAPPYGNPQQPA